MPDPIFTFYLNHLPKTPGGPIWAEQVIWENARNHGPVIFGTRQTILDILEDVWEAYPDIYTPVENPGALHLFLAPETDAMLVIKIQIHQKPAGNLWVECKSLILTQQNASYPFETIGQGMVNCLRFYREAPDKQTLVQLSKRT